MTRKSIASAILMALAMAQDVEPEEEAIPKRGEFGFGALHECLVLDADHIVMYEDHYRYDEGGWVDDGEILYAKWAPGMGVRAINYCIDDVNNTFKSM